MIKKHKGTMLIALILIALLLILILTKSIRLDDPVGQAMTVLYLILSIITIFLVSKIKPSEDKRSKIEIEKEEEKEIIENKQDLYLIYAIAIILIGIEISQNNFALNIVPILIYTSSSILLFFHKKFNIDAQIIADICLMILNILLIIYVLILKKHNIEIVYGANLIIVSGATILVLLPYTIQRIRKK